MVNPNNNLTVEQAGEMLRQASLRRTISRIAVLQHLSEISTPESHAEIASGVEEHGLENSTIYRSLNDLVNAGLVKRFDFGDHIWRFELVSSSKSQVKRGEHNAHFVCSSCGRIECLASIKRSHLGRNKDPEVIAVIDDIIIRGRCATCEPSTEQTM